MLWREELIPVNPFSRPGKRLQAVRNIVIHYTANPGASAAAHVRYFGQTLARQNPNDNTPDRYASAHMFVDKIEAVLIIPLHEMAYHASQANPYSIGVEMCIEKDGTIHLDTFRRTTEIVAHLCREYGLNPLRDVIRHYDVTGKICPKPYVDDPKAWEGFKLRVQAILKGGEEKSVLDRGVAKTIINTWMKPSWEEANAKRMKAEAEGRSADAEAWKKQCDYIHWLANQLRIACGAKEDEEL